MGPVPPDFSLERVVGRELNQICIGPYDLQFRFDCDFVVSCQGRVVAELDGASVVVFKEDEPPWVDVAPLPRLAGRTALSWQVEGTHEFSITLSDGARIRFVSFDCPYEEFSIQPDGFII